MIQTITFYLFAALLILSAVFVIMARNPVHSVLWLIVCFFNAAALMILIGAEFIAMLLVIVYVGAVAVLFLFVVMMLDIDFAELRAGFVKNFPFGIILAIVLLAELVLGFGAYRAGGLDIGMADGTAAPIIGESNIESLGALLYGRYLFLFEAAGVVLLVAMVGAIVLTLRQRSEVRGQNIAHQIARRPEDATYNASPETGKGVRL
ncbi:NADH-quinone oxidoreductase subunit J [uncultured Croceicoccus sp.]|uniref:NADH-quinone oxidoreductase subunit J n=1 Tax=uncultured Croceicoccus sp. TaxID=1295329 RepID=UPI002613E255|nr:NADH-quinone oxidoreductase subunit J [uncultured Croceicoccus sp.]